LTDWVPAGNVLNGASLIPLTVIAMASESV
jgi:hypothetical protein